jgi:hypothetical protein
MSNKATNIETATRLNRNLSLLHAGSMVTIEIITPAGQRAKFRTTFIGYLPKKYVLIQFPDINNSVILLNISRKEWALQFVA